MAANASSNRHDFIVSLEHALKQQAATERQAAATGGDTPAEAAPPPVEPAPQPEPDESMPALRLAGPGG